jgi:hypothetical protein
VFLVVMYFAVVVIVTRMVLAFLEDKLGIDGISGNWTW